MEHNNVKSSRIFLAVYREYAYRGFPMAILYKWPMKTRRPVSVFRRFTLTPLLVLFLLVCAAQALPVFAQSQTPTQGGSPPNNQGPPALPGNIAELKAVIDVRDAKRAGTPNELIEKSRIYLKRFPRGNYSDEVLLALGEGEAQTGKGSAALRTYNRLIKLYPESPFREQAMVNSLPILQATGQTKAAMALVERLDDDHPDSLEKDQALVWKARQEFKAKEYKSVLSTLDKVDNPGELGDASLGVFYRLLLHSRMYLDKPPGRELKAYLKHPDSPENKANVFMHVGAMAREKKDLKGALEAYRMVTEEYPVQATLAEALYWRGKLFYQLKVQPEEGKDREELVAVSIAHFSAYLETGDFEQASEVRVMRGGLLREQGKLEEALEDYQRAMAEKPSLENDPDLLLARVALFAEMNRQDETVNLLSDARRNPNISPLLLSGMLLETATVYYDAKNCDQVESLLNPMPLFKAQKNRGKAAFMRGFCRYQNQQWAKATFDLEGLINDTAYLDLVVEPLLGAYEQSGQHARMVLVAEELIRSKRLKPTPALLKRVSLAYEKLNEPGLMLAIFRDLEEDAPKAFQDTRIQLSMGTAEEKLGNKKEAKARYLQVLPLALDDDPKDSEAYFQAVRRLQSLYSEEGDSKALEALIKNAQEAFADDPQFAEKLTALEGNALLAKSRALMKEEKPGEAAAELQGTLKKLGPAATTTRVEAVAMLMGAYAATKSHDKALALYTKEYKAIKDANYRNRLNHLGATQLLEQKPPSTKSKARKPLTAFYLSLIKTPPKQEAGERERLRKRLTAVVDRIYQQSGDFEGREKLARLLIGRAQTDEEKATLTRYLSRVYVDWGNQLLTAKQNKAALQKFTKAKGMIPQGDWRRKYEIISGISRVLLDNKQFGEVVLTNEDILPEVEDKALAAQIRHFLGQVYLEWGKAAEKKKNHKSARMRYEYALDYLPESDWQRRMAATIGLGKTLITVAESRKPVSKAIIQQAASAYEALIPQLPEATTQQQYAMYLGRLYLDKLKALDKARDWLNQADKGSNDPVSVEAVYIMSRVEILDKRSNRAINLLEQVVGRDLSKSNWRIPVHYRLAVLYHQDKKLKKALPHYRLVRDEQSPELKKLYPRSIKESRKKAKAIEAYLKSGGKNNGSRIDVPRVKRK